MQIASIGIDLGKTTFHLVALGERGMRLGCGAHEVSDNGMASVGGDVAGDDWDNFGVDALGLHTTYGTCRKRVA